MKIILFLLCIALAGCGAKSNEDIAKDLIKEKLKATLPDFNDYEALNFGTMGTASLPYEETSQCIVNLKALKICNDSITLLEKIIRENKPALAGDGYKERLRQLQDSSKAKNDRNNAEKQSYIPEKLFKISHAYILKDKSGVNDKKTEDEFYLDKDLKKVVKVHKVY